MKILQGLLESPGVALTEGFGRKQGSRAWGLGVSDLGFWALGFGRWGLGLRLLVLGLLRSRTAYGKVD